MNKKLKIIVFSILFIALAVVIINPNETIRPTTVKELQLKHPGYELVAIKYRVSSEEYELDIDLDDGADYNMLYVDNTKIDVPNLGIDIPKELEDGIKKLDYIVSNFNDVTILVKLGEPEIVKCDIARCPIDGFIYDEDYDGLYSVVNRYTPKHLIVASVGDKINSPNIQVVKPVIYLYPEETTEVSVELDYDGELTTTYPKYDNGWKVTASPDGKIEYAGMEYNYLYWEGDTKHRTDFSTGFCIAGEDSEKFLEEKLGILGLNRKEANEFIVYWLPQMEHNKYNLISFDIKEYNEYAKLNINPQPDSIIRVYMSLKPLNEKIDIQEQILETPERKGFTVVEWGGSLLN